MLLPARPDEPYDADVLETVAAIIRRDAVTRTTATLNVRVWAIVAAYFEGTVPAAVLERELRAAPPRRLQRQLVAELAAKLRDDPPIVLN